MAPTNLTSGGSNASSATYTTASVAPAANALVLVTVGCSVGSGTPPVPTVSGAGGIWVQVKNQVSVAGVRQVTVFRDLNPTPGSGALTISFPSNPARCIWSVDQVPLANTSGSHGSGAIVQSIGSPGTASTVTGWTVNLAGLANAANIAFGAIRTTSPLPAPGTVVKGANFTELANVPTSAGYIAILETEWATNQTAVNWTWASTTLDAPAIAIEVSILAGAVNNSLAGDTGVFTKTGSDANLIKTAGGATFYSLTGNTGVFTESGNAASLIKVTVGATPVSNLTFGGSAGQPSFDTSPVSLAQNALTLVSVGVYNNQGSTADPTVTGAGGTWVKIASVADASAKWKVLIFRDLSSSPGSGVLTIDFGINYQTGCVWSVDSVSGVDQSGTHGSGAIVQNSTGVVNGTSTTGITCTLNAFGSANNTAYGFCFTNPLNGNLNPLAGFIESASVSGVGANAEAESEHNHPVVSWTWSSQSPIALAIALELKAATVAIAYSLAEVTGPIALSGSNADLVRTGAKFNTLAGNTGIFSVTGHTGKANINFQAATGVFLEKAGLYTAPFCTGFMGLQVHRPITLAALFKIGLPASTGVFTDTAHDATLVWVSKGFQHYGLTGTPGTFGVAGSASDLGVYHFGTPPKALSLVRY